MDNVVNGPGHAVEAKTSDGADDAAPVNAARIGAGKLTG